LAAPRGWLAALIGWLVPAGARTGRVASGRCDVMLWTGCVMLWTGCVMLWTGCVAAYAGWIAVRSVAGLGAVRGPG